MSSWRKGKQSVGMNEEGDGRLPSDSASYEFIEKSHLYQPILITGA